MLRANLVRYPSWVYFISLEAEIGAASRAGTGQQRSILYKRNNITEFVMWIEDKVGECDSKL